MAVQRINYQLCIFVADRMLQDDRRAIIEWRVIVAEAMNNPVKRCQDWRTSLHENIEANIYCAPFRSIVPCQFILVTCVYWACFVISTNANLTALSLHPIEEMARKYLNIGELCQITQ